VAGAYRATLIRELEKKVLVSLIDIYYNELCASHIRRTYSSLARVFIQKQYKIIRERLRRRRRQKGAACLRERHVRKNKVGKAARAGVQLPEQESGAYKVKRKIAQRTRP
jgi:ribose 1,5-bisphosphokinase PhnN